MTGPVDLVTAALDLLALTGWHLFPTINKIPATEHGFKDATNDPEELRRLFAARPDADGFAVDCGRSGLVVLDLDSKPGLDGRDSARDAGLPYLETDTLRAGTPRGGEHGFYAGVTSSRTGVLPGVDIKSAGGYVVLPPAPGRVWLVGAAPGEIGIAPAPEWLLGLARQREAGSAKAWKLAVGEIVEEGRRNVTCTSIAGLLVGRQVPPQLAFWLLTAWARTYCEPPLSDRDVETVLLSVLRLEASR
jgi:putative DNA primase/helicase